MMSSSQCTITLRVVGADNWELWRKLRLEALRDAPYAFSSTLAEWQGDGDTEVRWRARLSTVPVNFVADLNGLAAGMVSATAANQDATVELISMWVARFARGRGVGDSLVAAVIEWARGQRAARIALAVVESNKQAVNLYRRHGFVDVGAIDCTGSGIPLERKWCTSYSLAEIPDPSRKEALWPRPSSARPPPIKSSSLANHATSS